jgi:carbon starvation protein
MNDGHDYVPTNRWIVFGHHFAAIAGPDRSSADARGAVRLSARRDLDHRRRRARRRGAGLRHPRVVSRRNGKSLGQMAREEIGPVAGTTALVAVVGIMVVLLAVLGSWSSTRSSRARGAR